MLSRIVRGLGCRQRPEYQLKSRGEPQVKWFWKVLRRADNKLYQRYFSSRPSFSFDHTETSAANESCEDESYSECDKQEIQVEWKWKTYGNADNEARSQTRTRMASPPGKSPSICMVQIPGSLQNIQGDLLPDLLPFLQTTVNVNYYFLKLILNSLTHCSY